jgi:hypothetical protein
MNWRLLKQGDHYFYLNLDQVKRITAEPSGGSLITFSDGSEWLSDDNPTRIMHHADCRVEIDEGDTDDE